MPTRDVAAEFDQISLVYDETREPLDPHTIDGLSRALRRAGTSSLLEVGVGTGRVAGPLTERGFDVTGLDASIGMLSKARAKGLPKLVRGSGYRLPFGDTTFDATLFVHVLHVLDAPESAVREAARVSRVGACALVHPRSNDGKDEVTPEDGPREILREILREQGFPTPPRANPRTKERELLGRLPPDSLEVLGECDVTESLRDRLDRLAKRGQRSLLTIPPEALRRAVEVARERVGDRTVTYRRVEALALWRPERWSADTAPGATSASLQ